MTHQSLSAADASAAGHNLTAQKLHRGRYTVASACKRANRSSSKLSPSRFCEAQHGSWREAVNAFQGVQELLVSAYKTKSVQLPMEVPSLNSIAAQCCQAYPVDTGTGFQHLEQPAFISVNMKEPLLIKFFTEGYRILAKRNISFTLVTAGDDISVPWEHFHCSKLHKKGGLLAKPGHNATAHPSNPVRELRKFLASPLLRHMYTQNYDLVPHMNKRIGYSGCGDRIAHDGYDSTLGWGEHPGDEELFQKVSPIPIGIRVVVARDNRIKYPQFGTSHSAVKATQWAGQDCRSPNSTLVNLQGMAMAAPCFLEKERAILITFAADPKRDIRVNVFKALTAPGSPTVRLHGRRTPRDMYQLISRHMFVAAPSSHGQDTIRFWEILYMGSIPVLLRGPLDSLYEPMPCILIDSWEGITARHLAIWEKQILRRFGQSPFANPRVQRRLTNAFWVERIRRGAPTWADSPVEMI